MTLECKGTCRHVCLIRMETQTDNVVEKENTQELEIQGNEVRILTDNHSLEIEVASSVLREDFLAPFWALEMEDIIGLHFFSAE